MSNPPLPELPNERRSQVVTIKGRRFRVREPEPVQGFEILTQVAKLLGPTLTKLLSGQIVVMAPAECPVCGAKGQAEKINGNRWLCGAPIGPEGATIPCKAVWPQVPERVLDTATVLSDQGLRVLFAAEVERALTGLDKAAARALMLDLLVGNSDFDVMGQWVPLRSLEALNTHAPDGRALAVMMKCALECWVLPTLAGDATDISPDSPADATPGASLPTSGTPGITRAPPPTPKRGRATPKR